MTIRLKKKKNIRPIVKRMIKYGTPITTGFTLTRDESEYLSKYKGKTYDNISETKKKKSSSNRKTT